MPDVRKVNSGQPLKFVAEEWNRLADVANSNGAGGAIGEGLSVPACLVRVNVTGGALPVGSIIVPDENLISDAFRNRETPTLRCATPNGNPHALMLVEPYNGRDLAAAVVSGCTWCKVNVVSTSHRYANPVSGDSDKLHSGHTGTVAILQPPTTTGNQYLFVCFGVGNSANEEWVRITVVATSDPGPYTGVKGNLTGAAWADVSPTVTYTTIYRAPSNIAPPKIPIGQHVRIVPSPTMVGAYEIDAVGGMQTVAFTALTSICAETQFQITGRDLSIVPGTPSGITRTYTSPAIVADVAIDTETCELTKTMKSLQLNLCSGEFTLVEPPS